MLYVCILYLKYKKHYKSTAPSTKKQWQELGKNWEVQRMFIFASFGAGTFFCVMTSITDVEEENVMGQNAVQSLINVACWKMEVHLPSVWLLQGPGLA